ncbi:hypothetical protein K7X08_003445 [Anisodus acutangulus]|uniref:Ninja-family protein n=1 Tax=Anisodus acutangulus TaxID=402998 RepID=A0A9Q1MFC2_9SOLA|nr:hypothetical protein K7X08_003445 [Anisodus acutangulus]
MLTFLNGNCDEDENGIELSLGLSIGGSYSNKKMNCNSDDKMLIEWQRSQKRAIHREIMENEELVSKQAVRRKWEIGTVGNGCGTYEAAKSLNLSLNQDSYVNNQNVAVALWARNARKRELMKKNCRGFRLYNENMSYNQCGSSESEENLSGKSSFKNYNALSNGSMERCSSTISECQSSSSKGRSSSDNGQGVQPSTSDRKDSQFKLLTSSNVIPIKEEQDQTVERRTQLGAKMDPYADSIHNPASTNQANVGPFSSIKNCGMVPLLSRMLCVSTTGNGPNGKTINGFLCKYNIKTDISIVCVCHGNSFTPSEFVEHAGGVDVSHPLRYITVIPSYS